MFQLQYSIANAQIQMWGCLCKFSKCYLFHSNMLILQMKGQGKWLDCSLRSFFLHPSSWPRCHLPVLLNPSPYLHSAAFPHHPLTALLAPSERVPSPTVSPWLHPWGRTPALVPLFILSFHTFPFACCLLQPLPQQDLSFKDLYLSPFLFHFSTSNQVKLLWCFRACVGSCSQSTWRCKALGGSDPQIYKLLLFVLKLSLALCLKTRWNLNLNCMNKACSYTSL